MLNNTKRPHAPNPHVSLTLPLLAMRLGEQGVTELVQSGQVTMNEGPTQSAAMLGSAVECNPAFNMVTPPTGP